MAGYQVQLLKNKLWWCSHKLVFSVVFCLPKLSRPFGISAGNSSLIIRTKAPFTFLALPSLINELGTEQPKKNLAGKICERIGRRMDRMLFTYFFVCFEWNFCKLSLFFLSITSLCSRIEWIRWIEGKLENLILRHEKVSVVSDLMWNEWNEEEIKRIKTALNGNRKSISETSFN